MCLVFAAGYAMGRFAAAPELATGHQHVRLPCKLVATTARAYSMRIVNSLRQDDPYLTPDAQGVVVADVLSQQRTLQRRFRCAVRATLIN